MNELEAIEQARELVPTMSRLDGDVAMRLIIDSHLMTIYEFQYYLEELRKAQYALENFYERLGELERMVKRKKGSGAE